MERANVDGWSCPVYLIGGKAILYTLLIFNIAISLGVKESSVAALLGTAGVTVGLGTAGRSCEPGRWCTASDVQAFCCGGLYHSGPGKWL